MERTLESFHQRPKKAGEQAAPGVGLQNGRPPDQGSLRKSTPVGLPAIVTTSPDAKGNRLKTSSADSLKSISTFAEKKREEVCKLKYLIQIRFPAEEFVPS